MLLTARARWKSDDMIKQQNVVQRFDYIENDFVGLKDFVELCLAPLTVLLLENQSLQVQLDMQEELDRQKIALFGARNPPNNDE